MKKNWKRILIPAALLLTAGIIFVSVRLSLPKDDACAENVVRLQTMEDSDISQTEKELQALKNSDKEEALSKM